MQNFMITLLICSVTMSALALFYMAVTPLLTKRYSVTSRYYAWIVVVIGLIIPFRPQFSNSLVKVDIPSDSVVPYIQIGNGTPVTAPLENALSPALPTLWQIVAAVWFVGIIVFLAYHVIKHYHFLKLLSRWSKDITDEQTLTLMQDLKSQMGLSKNIGLQFCDSIGSPMMIGFAHPRILLPEADFAKDELSFILKHELVHYQRKDLWYKCLVLIATAIHWFNPIVYLMAKAIDIQCELSCDEKVVRGTNADIRLYYSETIIGVVRHQSKLKTALSTNFYGGKKGMKKRIFSIMDTSKKKVGLAVLCSTLILTLGTGFVFATSANAENDNLPQAYATDTVITQQEQAELDKQHTAELTKQYSVYKEYGLTYEPKSDSLYFNGKLVRWFSDKVNADNQYVTFVKDNDGMDLRAVRNNSYKLTGIAEVKQAEYEEHTQSIKAARSTNGAYEQGDPSADLAEQSNLLSEYGSFGMSFNSSGDMLYNNELVRYFCDGVELEAGAWSTRYQYLNKKGIVDVFTKRSVIDLGNGGKDPFGNLIGLEKSTQKEFEQRDLSDFSVSSEQANADLYSIYVPFDLTVNEQTGKLYYDGKLVRCFDDQIPTANFSSKGIGYYEKDGVIDIRTNRENTTGELLGLEKLSGSEFQKRVITDPTQPISQTGTDIFDEYKVFGLSYDKSQNALFYNGERVRLFTDIRNSNGKPIDSDEFLGSTTSNLDANGTIDVYTVRDRQTDENGDKKLTGLRIATQDEFDQATKSMGQTTRIVESAK